MSPQRTPRQTLLAMGIVLVLILVGGALASLI